MRALLLALPLLVAPLAAAIPQSLVTTDSTTTLKNIPSTAARYILRLGTSAPLLYKSSNTQCSLSAGAGDNGSQVRSADAKCWLAMFDTSGVSVLQFGAVCDGSTDDKTPLAAWLAYGVSSGKTLTLPETDCATSVPLVAAAASGLKIVGSSPFAGIKYTGASTTNDIVSLGTVLPAAASVNLSLQSFRISSSTAMTAGAGLHLKNVVRSTLRSVNLDGQDGNGKLFHGIWFDQIDKITYTDFQARGNATTGDALRVNGTVGVGPKADLYLAQCQLGGSGVGIHIGGGFGGLQVDTCGIAVNQNGILQNQTLAAEVNREIIIGGTVAIDANVFDGYQVSDPGGNGTITLYNWNSSNARYALNLVDYEGSVSIGGGRWFNNGDNVIEIQDASAILKIGQGWDCSNNTGYCIASSVGAYHVWWAGYNNNFGNLGVSGPSVYLAESSSTFAISITTGASAAISLPGMTGIVTVANVTSGLTGSYQVGATVTTDIALTPVAGGWESTTTTPAATHSSVAWDGAASYKIYNNTGGTVLYRIAVINARDEN